MAGLQRPSRRERKAANLERLEIRQLERELKRKEKALAETAALLGPVCTHFAVGRVSPLAHRVAHVGHARRRDGLHDLDPDLAADGFE